MVSAATKRRRQQRANLTAEAIEDSRREAQVEKKLLGTTVTADAPNDALFQIDRSGQSKDELRQKKARDAKEEARLLRQARRGNAKSRALLKSNKVRRSERFATPAGDEGESNMEGLSFPEGSLKKSHGIGNVEKSILKKRTFMADRHHEKRNKALERLEIKPGSHDLWTSDTKTEVERTICQTRKDFAKKHNRKYRRAKAIIYPDAGSSINPSYEHHQDKLGEALAKIVAKEDREQVYDDQLAYDPELFKNDRTDNIDKRTGMNVDKGDNDDEQEKEEEGEDAPKQATERKTRVQRNKEKRKRALQSAIEKKQRKAKVEEDFARIDELVEIAQEEADKFNGEAKRRARKNHVRVPNRRPNRPVLRKIAGERVRKEDDVEPVALKEDLGDSLRNAKIPDNNPMIKDRMLSFERRGFVDSHKVMVKEMHNVRQFELRDSMRDKTKRKGKHSKSDISYWKEKSKK